jgi:hypothetical protein
MFMRFLYIVQPRTMRIRSLARPMLELGSCITRQLIKPHMPVVSSENSDLGTVDHVEGRNKIALAKDEAGQHHYIPLVVGSVGRRQGSHRSPGPSGDARVVHASEFDFQPQRARRTTAFSAPSRSHSLDCSCP